MALIVLASLSVLVHGQGDLIESYRNIYPGCTGLSSVTEYNLLSSQSSKYTHCISRYLSLKTCTVACVDGDCMCRLYNTTYNTTCSTSVSRYSTNSQIAQRLLCGMLTRMTVNKQLYLPDGDSKHRNKEVKTEAVSPTADRVVTRHVRTSGPDIDTTIRSGQHSSVTLSTTSPARRQFDPLSSADTARPQFDQSAHPSSSADTARPQFDQSAHPLSSADTARPQLDKSAHPGSGEIGITDIQKPDVDTCPCRDMYPNANGYISYLKKTDKRFLKELFIFSPRTQNSTYKGIHKSRLFPVYMYVHQCRLYVVNAKMVNTFNICTSKRLTWKKRKSHYFGIRRQKLETIGCDVKRNIILFYANGRVLKNTLTHMGKPVSVSKITDAANFKLDIPSGNILFEKKGRVHSIPYTGTGPHKAKMLPGISLKGMRVFAGALTQNVIAACNMEGDHLVIWNTKRDYDGTFTSHATGCEDIGICNNRIYVSTENNYLNIFEVEGKFLQTLKLENVSLYYLCW